MKASELVKAAMDQTKVSSRYALAKITGVSERHLSYYVKNERWPDNNHARMLAEAAGLNPLKVIAELEMARAEDDSTRTAWGKALASVTGKAVMVLLAFIVTITVIPGTSVTTTKVVVFAHLIDDNFYYVNLDVRAAQALAHNPDGPSRKRRKYVSCCPEVQPSQNLFGRQAGRGATLLFKFSVSHRNSHEPSSRDSSAIDTRRLVSDWRGCGLQTSNPSRF